MEQSAVTVRRMTRKDLDLAIDWAALEGWNPGLHDADSFYATDPNGFFLAELDGSPVGSISAVAFDESYGFMGFYIVRPDLRDHGIGMQLWDAAMAYMGNRTIGADGVVSMLNKYALSGFQMKHKNARYEGVGKPAATDLTDLADVPFPELAAYDRPFFPADRSRFLQSWISHPGTRGRALLAGGRLAGYGVIRPCRRGFKIGPLFGDTPVVAEELFVGLAALVSDQPVFLDIPVVNPAAQGLVERHGMKMVFETARIYRGSPPALPLHRTFGITTFELG